MLLLQIYTQNETFNVGIDIYFNFIIIINIYLFKYF